MNGVPLAVNEQNYRIVMVREDAGDVDDVLARLQISSRSTTRRSPAPRKRWTRRSPFVPVTIADRVSWEDISRVTVNAPALPGIIAEVGLSRHYPRGSDTAHVVGYVGPVSRLRPRARSRIPIRCCRSRSSRSARPASSRSYEMDLRGSAGTRRIEVNALGRVMRELDRQDGDAGRTSS